MSRRRVKVRVRVPVDRGKHRRARVRRFFARAKRYLLVGAACGLLALAIWILLHYLVPSPPPPQ